MSWIVLIVSGALESVWANALARSDGFTRLGPVAVFFVACALSMGGLGYALRDIPVGTGYAVWVAIGAVTTVVVAAVTGAEVLSIAKILLLLGIVGCVIGLKLVS